MDPQEMLRLMVLGTIGDLPEEQRLKASECAEKIRQLVKEYGVPGKLALALVGAEAALEQEPGKLV